MALYKTLSRINPGKKAIPALVKGNKKVFSARQIVPEGAVIELKADDPRLERLLRLKAIAKYDPRVAEAEAAAAAEAEAAAAEEAAEAEAAAAKKAEEGKAE